MASGNPNEFATLKDRALVGAAAMIARGVGVRVLSVAALLAVAGILGPEEFGIATFSLTGMMLMDLLANASLAAALVRRTEEPERVELAAALGLQLLLAVAIAGLVVFAGLASDSEIGETLAVTALALPLSVVRTPAVVITERRLEYGPIVVADLAESAVFSTVAVVLAATGAGPYAVAVAIVARKATGSLVLALRIPASRIAPRWDLSVVRPILAFGLQFQAASLIDQGRDQMLNVGIALVASVSAVGLWSAAFRFLQLPFIFLQGIWRVAFPAFSRMRAQTAELRSTLERAIGVAAVVLAGLVAGLIALGPDAFTLVLGEEWRSAYTVAAIASLGIVVNGPISVIAAGYLWAEGRSRQVLVIMAASAAVWLATGLSCLALFGITGVGIGWTLSSLCEAVWFGYAIRRLTSARLGRRVAVPVVCAAGAVVCGLAVTATFGPHFWTPVAGGCLGLSAYVALMALADRAALERTLRLVPRTLRGMRQPQPQE